MADQADMGNPPEKKGGLFVIKSSKPKEAPQPSVSAQEISSLSGRMRVIEERLYNLRRKIQLTDQSVLAIGKKMNSELKDTSQEMKELRMDMEDLRNVIQQVITEMKKFASKNEVGIVKKYVDLWEPLNFVTRKEVNQIIEEKLFEMKNMK